MNADTTAFMCQSCHERGNAVSFTADILSISPLEATRMLKQRYKPTGIDIDSRNMREEIKRIRERAKKSEKRENAILPESALDAYRVDWGQEARKGAGWAMYMFKRGFRLPDLYGWQFGYSREFDRITLPIRDEMARLVGIKARAWNLRKPKYLNLRDDANGVKPYLKNEVVFGLDHYLTDTGHLIVVEGEFNVVAMHAYGFRNTVAINGSYFGERQIKLLKQYADSITLFFDSDQAGRDATEALSNALRPFLQVYVCPEHHGDPASMHKASILHCLNDRESVTRRMLARS